MTRNAALLLNISGGVLIAIGFYYLIALAGFEVPLRFPGQVLNGVVGAGSLFLGLILMSLRSGENR